jgi:hypothetical protein
MKNARYHKKIKGRLKLPAVEQNKMHFMQNDPILSLGKAIFTK